MGEQNKRNVLFIAESQDDFSKTYQNWFITVEPRYNQGPRDWQNLLAIPRFRHTEEPRYNEPLYNEVLGITNDFLYPSNSKIYEKKPRYNRETSV